MDKENQLIEKYLGWINKTVFEDYSDIEIILEELEYDLNHLNEYGTTYNTAGFDTLMDQQAKQMAISTGVRTAGVMIAYYAAIKLINNLRDKAIRKCGVVRIGKTKKVCIAKVRLITYEKIEKELKKVLKKCKTAKCKEEVNIKLQNNAEKKNYQKEILKNTKVQAGKERSKQGIKNATDKTTIRL